MQIITVVWATLALFRAFAENPTTWRPPVILCTRARLWNGEAQNIKSNHGPGEGLQKLDLCMQNVGAGQKIPICCSRRVVLVMMKLPGDREVPTIAESVSLVRVVHFPPPATRTSLDAMKLKILPWDFDR